MQCSVAWVLYANWDGSMPKQPNVRLQVITPASGVRFTTKEITELVIGIVTDNSLG